MLIDFKEISLIRFKRVLTEIFPGSQFIETDTQFKADDFIISKEKNLYFNPKGEDKGSVINFVAYKKNLGLRDAAKLILEKCGDQAQPAKEIPEYELHYCEWLAKEGIDEETAKKFEIGLVKTRGMAAGRIAIKIRDMAGQKVGYALLNPKDGSYFYFKGYHHDHIYNLHNLKGDRALLVSNPLLAVKMWPVENVIALTYPNLTEAQENLIKSKITYLELSTSSNAIISARLIHSVFVKIIR